MKGAAIVLACAGTVDVIACFSGNGNPGGLVIISLLIFLPGCFFTWQAFKKIHPVYFDDVAFYWKKGGVEQKVDYARVSVLEAKWLNGRGGYSLFSIYLKYIDPDGTNQTISFFPTSQFKYNPLWLLIQCEKVTRPDFEITGYKPPLTAEKEADHARKYDIRYLKVLFSNYNQGFIFYFPSSQSAVLLASCWANFFISSTA